MRWSRRPISLTVLAVASLLAVASWVAPATAEPDPHRPGTGAASAAETAERWRTAAAVPSGAVAVTAATRQSITRCYGTSPAVWLTFDDGGTDAQITRILDILAANRVRGMFFPTGQWAAAHPAAMTRMVRDGHVVGNHTSSHQDLTTLSDASAGQEIDGGPRGNAVPVSLLRPPYGAGAFTQRVVDLAAARSYRVCYWSVDTRDWDGSSAATIVARVRTGDSTTPPAGEYGVVLMHMQARYTGDALQGVVDAVKARGLALHALPAGVAGTVRTSGSALTVRSGPGTGYSSVGTVANSSLVTIYCQATGTTVTGSQGTSNLWDGIATGRYVSHAYVSTGDASGRVAPAC